MPDGRVLTAGSNPRRRDDELRLEVYHPPYLFRGPRPCIERAPAQIRLGETFTLHSPNALDIKWISLVRPMATTHSYDSDQRLVDVPFRTRGVCHLQARMPTNPNLVPPGYYMLFIVNRRGIPSVAKWVRVLPAAVRGKGLEAGDIVVGTAGKVVRIDPETMAMDTITAAGALGNARGSPSTRTGISLSSPTVERSSTWCRTRAHNMSSTAAARCIRPSRSGLTATMSS